ncbi:MAG TPA: ABC transporter ATP-binding protein [Euzebya sp.]|nr:ABC transporter ATP-binding protein [Euzebya sp.]
MATTIAPGEVVAVVGPNGAGKTTLLQLVAGLLDPDRGHVQLGASVLTDTAAGIHRPPAARRMGVVFQDHLLFDHMSVRENVAFGPRSAGAGRRRARAHADTWLDRVGLVEHASTPPAHLSGGQRQRVALARALASDPSCLLLDEPLSALDVQARSSVRRELRRHLADFAGPVLLVTHEPLEALALADRLIVLEGGRVTQSGDAATVARHPRSDWVARLVGTNLLSGHADGEAVAIDGGGTVHAAGPLPDGPLLLTVHPRSISLHRQRPTGSPRNVWQGTLEEMELAGDRVRALVGGHPALVAEVTAAAMAELRLADLASRGGRVWLSFKAADVDVYIR